MEADEFVKSAKSFADCFYFECTAKQTSKRVADSTQNANKAAKNVEGMEAQFTVNEESINDLVHRTVHLEVLKLRPVSLPVKTSQAPRKTSKKNEQSSSANCSKRHDLSRDGNQRKLSEAKNSAQGRRSRSKQKGQPRPRKPCVTFSESVKGRRNSVVKKTRHLRELAG